MAESSTSIFTHLSDYIDYLSYLLTDEPEPTTPAVVPRAPGLVEKSAAKKPKDKCKVGEHGDCVVDGCDCWCHEFRK